MRFPLGLGVLLVILLGALCVISPIRAHYNYDGASEEPSASSDEGAVERSGALSSQAAGKQQAEALLPDPSRATSNILEGNGSSDGNNEESAKEQAVSAAAIESNPAIETTIPLAAPEDDESIMNADPEAVGRGSNEKRQEGSKPFGIPNQTNSAGSDQEQQQPLSPPANQPSINQQQQQQQQPQQTATEAVQQEGVSQPSSLVGQMTQQQAQQQQQQQQQAQTGSSQRGLSELLNGFMNPNLINNQQQIPVSAQTMQQQQIQQQPQIQQQQIQMLPQQQLKASHQQSQQQPTDIPRENLPTIIENNQQQQQQQQQQPQQQQGSTALVLPPAQPEQPGANSSALAPSTSRTFGEGWTNCQGGSSGKYGTCKNDVNCKKDKGIPDGSCMSGLGVCCVMALTCNDKSSENNTFFANPDFPEPSWEARLCEVEIKKKHSKIIQIMIEFEEFELAPPNHDGECITDVFQVKLGSGRPSPYSLLRMCGQNTGQHMYLDVSQIEEPLLLSVATSGGGFPRRWSIRIVQMDEKNHLLAPPGCLQYYTDTIGHFRSFNLGQNLRNLYYAICFRIDNGYSGIRFTSNFFGMNGQHCRKQKPHSIGGPPHKHTNMTSYEAHPHHLVIPPPGHAMPPPRPKYQTSPPPPPPHAHPPPHFGYMVEQPPNHYPGSQKMRVKRLAYAEMPETGERYARTLHEHDKEEKVKHEHHHEHHMAPPPSYAPGYGQSYSSPSYGPPPPPPPPPPSYAGGYSSGYGPPPPHQMYGHEHHSQHPHHHQHDKEEKKDDKWFWQDNKWTWKGDKMEDKYEDKYGYKEDKWGWKADKKEEKLGWWGEKKDDKFGWKSDKKEEKYDYKQPYPSAGYQHQSYGPPGYYGPPTAVGGYGPPAYGHGEYHHKEIDKFGKKYEHLEYKHEKNHLDKESKKDEKWWSFWNKKEEKKDKKDKEKFFQHHEALFPMMHIPEMPHCEPRFCGANDVITFPPSGDSISEMCGNRFNRGRGPKIISGSPLVVYVSNRGHNRGAGFDLNYEQVFYVPKPYKK